MKLAPLIPAPTQSLPATIAAIVQLHELRYRDEIEEVQTHVDKVRWYTPAEYVAMMDNPPTLLGGWDADPVLGAVPTVEIGDGS